ncbi:MAG: permease-like cell division protein FtsX [Tannerella sp.]|jgi:cell division transport system permease protein|nr:permease-like cell division protein FtsX [Tannerella sp.]
MTKNKKTFPVSYFNSNLISIMSTSLVLFLIGLFFIMGLLSKELSVYMKENFAFSIVLKDDVKEADARQMQKNLNAMPFIKSVKYVSKEDAAREMIAELGEDPQLFLGFNPFQASIEVRLKSEYMNADSLQTVQKKLASSAGVSELIYPEDMLQIVNHNVQRIGIILFVLIIVLMIISFALISNTIRLLIYSKRFLIYTMRLVGATNAFIRRPFIKYNLVSGFLAGILAIMMLMSALYMLQKLAGLGLEPIVPWDRLWMVYVTVMVAGIFISAVSAYLAVNRYLRMERGKMYYI